MLEGTVRRAGNRIRVTVQLVDVENGFQLWSGLYDPQMEDLFDVQEEIARAVTERFKMTLAGAVKRSTQDLHAYELYLKGRHYWHQRLPSTLRLLSSVSNRLSIAINPGSSLARAYNRIFLATEGHAEQSVKRTTLACQMDPL